MAPELTEPAFYRAPQHGTERAFSSPLDKGNRRGAFPAPAATCP